MGNGNRNYAKFVAVPAVPIVNGIVGRPNLKEVFQVQTVEESDEKERVAVLTKVSPVTQRDDFVSANEKRKQFKRCHGKCVQKFCLPVDVCLCLTIVQISAEGFVHSEQYEA